MQGIRVFFKKVLFLGWLLSAILGGGQLVWASPLIHVLYTAQNNSINTLSNYYIHYHNDTPIAPGQRIVDIAFPAGFILPTTCGPIRLYVDGQNIDCADIVFNRSGDGVLSMSVNQMFSSDRLIDVYIDNVINAPTPGPASFVKLQTADALGNAIDQAAILPTITLNYPPTLSGIPASAVTQDQFYSFIPIASDVEGSPLTFSLINAPSWMSVNPSTGEVSGSPSNADVGHNSAIVLQVSDGQDITALSPFSVEVVNVNDAPTITGIPQTTIDQGMAYDFTPFVNDPDGDALTYMVSNRPSWLNFDASSGRLFGTPGQSDIGTFLGVEINVFDGVLMDSLIFNLTVNDINIAPMIGGSPSLFVMQGQGYSFTPITSDADGMPLMFAATNLPSWLNINMFTGEVSGTPANGDVGRHENIIISVNDGMLTSSLAPFSIDVINVNDAPTISGTPATTTNQNAPYSFVPAAADIDGDALDFSVVNRPIWASFNTITGELSGVPSQSDIGDHLGVTISVFDGHVSVPLSSFNIEVLDVNDPPSISGAPPLTVQQDMSYEFIPMAHDIDGDSLTFDILNQPAWASFDTLTGRLSGTPSQIDLGLFPSISISVRDAFGTVFLPPFNINVTNVNDAPNIAGIPQTAVNQDSFYSFTPFGSDIDGDALTFSIVNQPDWLTFDTATGQLFGTPEQQHVGFYGGIEIRVSDGGLSAALPAFSITVNDVNDPPLISGSPALFVMQDQDYLFVPDVFDYESMVLAFSAMNLPNWLTLDPATGMLQGTPSNDDVGLHENIEIIVTDGLLFESLAPFSIEVINVNDAPTIEGSPAISVNQDAPYTFVPSAIDIDGDELTFIVINRPAWLNFDSNSGELSGVPGNDDVGIYENIRISVNDGQVSAVLPSFTLEVINVNDAPFIGGEPALVVNQDERYEFVPMSMDDDGDELFFDVLNAPNWALFDSVTGTLSGMPTQADVGLYAGIVVSVSDGTETVSLPAFSIEVIDVNDAPVITGSPATSVTELQLYQFQVSGSDPDGDDLLFSITGLPAWASFDPLTGWLSGTPGFEEQGQYSGIVISVSDGIEVTALPPFSIEVVNLNRPPSITGSPPTQVLEGQMYQFQASGADPDNDRLTYSVNGAPSWLSMNASSGLLSGVPQNQNVGQVSGIVVRVSDGEDEAKLPPFNLMVVDVNQAPSLSGGNFSLVAGSRITITPVISDPDGDALTLGVSAPPSLGQLFLEGSVWVYQAPESLTGTDSFSLQVSDGQAQSPPAQFTIEILPVQDLVTNDVLVEPETPDEVYVLDVLENDIANTDEEVKLVASFSIFGDTSVESDLIRLELSSGDSQFITLDYIVENENGQLAVAQAVLVIRN